MDITFEHPSYENKKPEMNQTGQKKCWSIIMISIDKSDNITESMKYISKSRSSIITKLDHKEA